MSNQNDLILFNGPLTGSFQPTKGMLISAQRADFRFALTVSGAPADVEFYMEFGGGGKNAAWFAETAEEDAGGGDVSMPAVIRTLQAATGALIPIGVANFSAQFVRSEQLVRLQVRTLAGVVKALITSPYGRLAT